MTHSSFRLACGATAAAFFLAPAAAHAASVAIDPKGDLFAPFDTSDPRTAAFDIVKAGVSVDVTRGESGPATFGDYRLSGTMAGDIAPAAPVDYVWVVNRDLGPAAEQTLFADEGFAGVQGDGFVLARADGTLEFQDVSGLTESSGRALGRVRVDGERIDIELPSDALLAHRGGTLPDGFRPNDVRFAFLTVAERPVESSGLSGRFTTIDVAPDDGYLTPASREPVTVSPAPEPAAWTVMLGGLGLAGGALRSARRSRRPSVRAPAGAA